MKVNKICIGMGIAAMAFSTAMFAAANPVSYDKMVQYVNSHTSTLTAADWSAVCSSGSPTSAQGCFGEVSSSAFHRLDVGLGGFSTITGINTTESTAPNSVFIKAFLASTNTPVSNEYITVTVPSFGGMVRCANFAQAGIGISAAEGINTSIPSDGTSSFSGPEAPHVLAMNATSTQATTNYNYNQNSGNSSPANISSPIYFICVGVNSTNGSIPITITPLISAV